jgi:hypothetical protein
MNGIGDIVFFNFKLIILYILSFPLWKWGIIATAAADCRIYWCNTIHWKQTAD